ncbi:coiled-coil domain-containing protein 185 [Ambystoma mexicanum]|uniref:coiled-coil domain-containing protein 185 n=1 Tax=Ambystoma mexicanum TaxID=8296 RepID=UPI0037E71A4F
MGDAEPAQPVHLDLYNFEEKQHEGSRYVLTSPRSLEACARQGVRPVQLLHRPLEEFMDENPGAPLQLAAELYEAHERARRRTLRLCQEERQRLQSDERREEPPGDHGDRANYPRAALQHEEPRKPEKPAGRKEEKPAVHNAPDAVLRRVTESKDPPQNQARPVRKLPVRPEVAPGKSLSLGDLRSSFSAAGRQLHQLAAEIEREAQVSVPKRDKKIAALMLLKHQEECALERKRLEAEKAWEEVRRHEVRSRRRLERERKVQLGRRLQRWQQDLAERRARVCKEEQMAIEVASGENRRQQHAEEEVDRRRQELDSIRQRAESRRQGLERVRRERDISGRVARERGGRRLQQRLGRALQARIQHEAQERRRLRVQNEQAKQRHSNLRDIVENQARAEELLRRLSLEHKAQKSQEAYKQVLGERSKELRERAAREEEQIQRAQGRVEHQQKEQDQHKRQLLRLSEHRIQQAREQAQLSLQDRAERTREVNTLKERVHHILLLRVAEEEEIHRREVEHSILKKDRKSDKLLREKEAILEEARKVARASFQMREKVREQTKGRTFDQMVLEAQLNASLIKESK